MDSPSRLVPLCSLPDFSLDILLVAYHCFVFLEAVLAIMLKTLFWPLEDVWPLDRDWNLTLSGELEIVRLNAFK